MSETVDAIKAVAEVIPSLEDKVVQLANKLQEALSEHGGAAWDLAMYVVRVDSTLDILRALVFLVITFSGICYTKRLWNWGQSNNWPGDGIPICVLVMLSGVTALSAALTLSSSPSFVWGIFYLHTPELSIARKIIESVL